MKQAHNTEIIDHKDHSHPHLDHADSMKVLLLRAHVHLLETPIVVDETLSGVAVPLDQTEPVPYLLLLVCEE